MSTKCFARERAAGLMLGRRSFFSGSLGDEDVSASLGLSSAIHLTRSPTSKDASVDVAQAGKRVDRGFQESKRGRIEKFLAPEVARRNQPRSL